MTKFSAKTVTTTVEKLIQDLDAITKGKRVTVRIVRYAPDLVDPPKSRIDIRCDLRDGVAKLRSWLETMPPNSADDSTYELGRMETIETVLRVMKEFGL